MGYLLEVRDGADRVVARGDIAAELERRLPDVDDDAFPVLRYLDPYGDTYLNALQVRGMLPELARLAARCADEPAAARSLARLEDLTRVVLEVPHRFLVFVGD